MYKRRKPLRATSTMALHEPYCLLRKEGGLGEHESEKTIVFASSVFLNGVDDGYRM